MIGKRVAWLDAMELEPGDYCKADDGTWLGVTPNDLLAGLAKHSVTEHEDGTITASPSIKVVNGQGAEWHGYLERGVWRKC